MGSKREASIRWRDGMTFDGQAGSGHSLVLDAAPEVGGRGLGFAPVELLLMALAGCTGMDVISLLRKMRQDVTAYEVHVRGEQADEHPKVYTHITIEHVVTGHSLSEAAVQRAVDLSFTRYCPSSAMLGKTAEIKELIRIVEAPADA